MQQPKKLRVILVDDHDVLRLGLKMMLKKAEHIEIAGEGRDGEEAIDLAKRLDHDMVIMDFQMPRMDGIEACYHLVKSNPSERVLILSAHKEEMLVRRILEAGAKGFISKDSDLHEFLAAIKAISENRTYLSQNMRSENPGLDPVPNRVLGKKATIRVKLSKREIQIIQLISDGLKSQEIATECQVSVRTVEAHRRNIMKKMGFQSTAEMVKFCMKMGYVH